MDDQRTGRAGGANRASRAARTLLLAFAFIVCCAVLLAATVPWIPKLSLTWSEALLGVVTAIGAFVLTVVFTTWDRANLSDVGASPDRWTPARLLCGFVIGLVIVAFWTSMSAWFGYISWKHGTEMSVAVPVSSLAAYLALACREELAFHGYPLRRLAEPFGIWGAQLIVALVFATEHRLGGLDWTHAICGAGVGSLLFGMAAIATRGLAVPIGLHSAWNFGQWLLGFKPQPGVWAYVAPPGREAEQDKALMFIYAAVVGCATLGFWMWYLRKCKNRDNTCSDQRA